MANCPICNGELTTEKGPKGHALAEETGKCGHCGRYSYYFITGCTEIHVLADDEWRTFHFSYDQDPTERALMGELQGSAIERARDDLCRQRSMEGA